MFTKQYRILNISNPDITHELFFGTVPCYFYDTDGRHTSQVSVGIYFKQLVIFRVEDGSRTHDLQIHNLTL